MWRGPKLLDLVDIYGHGMTSTVDAMRHDHRIKVNANCIYAKNEFLKKEVQCFEW